MTITMKKRIASVVLGSTIITGSLSAFALNSPVSNLLQTPQASETVTLLGLNDVVPIPLSDIMYTGDADV